jgi:hypothetical protein
MLPNANPPSPQPAIASTPDTTPLLDTLTEDWKRLKQQKCRQTGGVEARVLQNLAFLYGEQNTVYRNKLLTAEPQDDNKLYLMFNLIASRFGKLIGRIGSMNGVYKAIPDRKDPKALAEAAVVEALDRALDQKLGEKQRMWERLFWLGVGGVAFEHVPWVPNASQELIPQFDPAGEVQWRDLHTGAIVSNLEYEAAVNSGSRPPETFEVYEEVAPVGEVGSEVFGPLNVFVDQSVKSVQDLAPDQRIYIAQIRTSGWIEENYDQKVDPDKSFEIVSTQFRPQGEALGGQFLKELIPLVQGTSDENDPPMNVVVHGYAPPSKQNPRGRYTCFVPGKKVLYDGECPYGEIPIVDYHFKPVTTTFWTGDYISDLIPPQRFLNKRLSQLGEQSNATLYSQILLGPGMTEKDVSSDAPGVMFNAVTDQGIPLVHRLAPPQLPPWFMNSIDLVVKLFNEIAGGADLFQESKFPGQLRGPMAVPMLQEILDTEWGHLYEHIGERTSLVKQMRINRVKQFYPPIRTLHYTDRDMKDEVISFHAEQILRSGVNYNISVERGSLLPELRALKEARLMERLSGPLAVLYLDERTGQLDKSKIAADLQFGDTGRASREAQYRKLAQDLNEMIWTGKPVPPVLPFYKHDVMMDELESEMATTEFLRADPVIQQAFSQRWEQHRFYLMQEAQAQQMGMQNSLIQNAVAQATQQAAAQAAAETVNSVMGQLQAQQGQDTQSLVTAAQTQAGGQPPAEPQRPRMPFQEPVQ